MSRESKLVVNQLIADFQKRPEDFKIDKHQLIDNKSNIIYWISNGWSFAKICEPYEMSFGFIQGARFHSALNKLKAWKMLKLSQ